MTILAVNTTSSLTQISLLYENNIYSNDVTISNSHSEKLISKCKDLLSEHNLDFSNLSKLLIVTGPGSFTGIRIGITFAKALKTAANISIIPITNFQCYALMALEENIDISNSIYAIDCGKNKNAFYASKLDNNLNLAKDPYIISYDNFKSAENPATKLIGNFDKDKITNQNSNIFYKEINFSQVLRQISKLENISEALTPLYIKKQYIDN